jgi:hypothetical protein
MEALTSEFVAIAGRNVMVVILGAGKGFCRARPKEMRRNRGRILREDLRYLL